MSEKKLRVWWMPQVPMDNPFYVDVKNTDEAIILLKTLAKYDLYQLENHIKPDFSNAGGLEEWNEEEQLWLDWNDENGYDIDKYIYDKK